MTKVDDYYDGLETWQDELRELRRIVLDLGLTEALKWRQPCYADNGSNVLILSCFKDAATVNFFKGSLLSDPAKVLVVPGENTVGGRFMRFTSVADIRKHEARIRAYVAEAVENERAGKTVDRSKRKELDNPEEMDAIFNDDPAFATAWDALTPGRQRGFLLQFTAAKRSATRTSRVLAARERVMAGKGPNDCICGHSKKMPRCDGSHKHH